MRGKFLHRAAMRGYFPGVIQRPESAQQITGTGKRRGRRRIQPAQRIGLRAPHREIECQWREIRDANFRRRIGRETSLGALTPKPEAHARRCATGAAPAVTAHIAREMRWTSSRLMPLDGSKRLRRSIPESTTMRTPSIVRLVSAFGGEHDFGVRVLRA
jgi:hypothetical protein